MGDIFQELIRKFNEALNENPGEHFTPPDVVRLMVSLLMCLDEQALTQEYIELTVYDPCCGTGGMLIAAKKWIEAMNLTATVRLFGQEVNPETYAVCKSDLYILSADGRDAEQIMFGTTLANPQHHRCFDYSGSQIDEVQQQQSANNSQGLVGYLSYSRTAIYIGKSSLWQEMGRG
jgi:type I restriction enzyme M protein